jgi:hypothetical protein
MTESGHYGDFQETVKEERMKRAFLLGMMLAAAPLPAFAQGTASAPQTAQSPVF